MSVGEIDLSKGNVIPLTNGKELLIDFDRLEVSFKELELTLWQKKVRWIKISVLPHIGLTTINF